MNTNAHVLNITQKALTVDLTTNASKIYGSNDPLVTATTPTFTGRVTASVTDWNSVVTAIDDTTAGKITLASLARTGGENVGSYNILSGTAGGTAIGNYTPTVNTNAHVLNITPAGALTGTIANQMKIYGSSDPLAGAIPVSLSGQVNTSVTNWNGNVTAIDDTTAGKVSVTLASIMRNAGENVGSYNYTGGALNPLGGSSSGNYAGATFNVGASVLDITQAALTVTANNQSKTFGTTFTFTGNEFTSAGLQNGETIGSVTLTSAGASSPAPVGPYPIIASAATGGTFSASNYTIGYMNGQLTVTSLGLLDGLTNPVLVGLQSLGIGVPPICLGEDYDFDGIAAKDVAARVLRKCGTRDELSEIPPPRI